MAHATDLRELDLQANPFLVALQDASLQMAEALAHTQARAGRGKRAKPPKLKPHVDALATLYDMVAARSGMLLLPPANMCPPAPMEPRWALRHVLLPLQTRDGGEPATAATPAAASASPATPATHMHDDHRSRSPSQQGDSSSGGNDSSLASQWQHPDGSRVHIVGGVIYSASDGSSGASTPLPAADGSPVPSAIGIPRARILLEELHYDEEFRSFRVLCVDRPLWGRGQAGGTPAEQRNGTRGRGASREEATIGSSPESAASLAAFSAGAPVPAALSSSPSDSPSSHPELRSLSEHRDVLTLVLGEDVATRCIFASPRLDFFLTDFALAWLGTVAREPLRAAEHLRAAVNRAKGEAVATLKRTVTGGGGSGGGAYSQSLLPSHPSTWSPSRSLELELAIQAHLASCLHSKIFSSLTRVPEHRAGDERLARAFAELDALGGVSLFDVGLSPHLVGLVDPRPAVDALKSLESLVTPLERLACLARVEGLLLDSVARRHAEVVAGAMTGPASSVAVLRGQGQGSSGRPGLNRFATLPMEQSKAITDAMAAANIAAAPVADNGATPRSRANSSADAPPRSRPRTASNASYSELFEASTPTPGGSRSGESTPVPFTLGSPVDATVGANGAASHAAAPVPIPARSSAAGQQQRQQQGGGAFAASCSPFSNGPSAASSAGCSPAWPLTSSLQGTHPPPSARAKLRRVASSVSSTASSSSRPEAAHPALSPLQCPSPSETASPIVQGAATTRHSRHAALSSTLSAPFPSSSEPLSISSDDLLPLLVFVLCQSRPASMHANIMYMRDFSPGPSVLSPGVHGGLMCRLANMEAAVTYVAEGGLGKHMREAMEATSHGGTANAKAAVTNGKPRRVGKTKSHTPTTPQHGPTPESTRALHLLLTPIAGPSAAAATRRTLFSPDATPTASPSHQHQQGTPDTAPAGTPYAPTAPSMPLPPTAFSAATPPGPGESRLLPSNSAASGRDSPPPWECVHSLDDAGSPLMTRERSRSIVAASPPMPLGSLSQTHSHEGRFTDGEDAEQPHERFSEGDQQEGMAQEQDGEEEEHAEEDAYDSEYASALQAHHARRHSHAQGHPPATAPLALPDLFAFTSDSAGHRQGHPRARSRSSVMSFGSLGLNLDGSAPHRVDESLFGSLPDAESELAASAAALPACLVTDESAERGEPQPAQGGASPRSPSAATLAPHAFASPVAMDGLAASVLRKGSCPSARSPRSSLPPFRPRSSSPAVLTPKSVQSPPQPPPAPQAGTEDSSPVRPLSSASTPSPGPVLTPAGHAHGGSPSVTAVPLVPLRESLQEEEDPLGAITRSKKANK